MFYSPPEKKKKRMSWCPSHVGKLPWCPFLNCWLASMPLQFNNVWRQFYIYKTDVSPMVLILHPECTISLFFGYFDVGWCLSRCKSGQRTRFWKFCESRRLQNDVLDQNVAWARFSRFLASILFITIFMYAAWKISSSSTSPWNLSSLWQLVYP